MIHDWKNHCERKVGSVVLGETIIVAVSSSFECDRHNGTVNLGLSSPGNPRLLSTTEAGSMSYVCM